MPHFNRSLAELKTKAVLHWPEEILGAAGDLSVLPLLLKTQDAFISLLKIANKDPLAWKTIIRQSNAITGPVFLNILWLCPICVEKLLTSMAHVIEREQWAEKPDVWHGEFQGGPYGAEVSVVFYSSDRIGGGPKLHKHPYPDVFIVRQGRALFIIGDKTIEASAGQILVAPANTPHKFTNLGPGRLESTDLHVAGAFATDWLE